MISVECPQCRKRYQIADAAAGKRAKCAACGTSIVVPAATAKVSAARHAAAVPAASAPEPAVAVAATSMAPAISDGLAIASAPPSYQVEIPQAIAVTPSMPSFPVAMAVNVAPPASSVANAPATPETQTPLWSRLVTAVAVAAGIVFLVDAVVCYLYFGQLLPFRGLTWGVLGLFLIGMRMLFGSTKPRAPKKLKLKTKKAAGWTGGGVFAFILFVVARFLRLQQQSQKISSHALEGPGTDLTVFLIFLGIVIAVPILLILSSRRFGTFRTFGTVYLIFSVIPLLGAAHTALTNRMPRSAPSMADVGPHGPMLGQAPSPPGGGGGPQMPGPQYEPQVPGPQYGPPMSGPPMSGPPGPGRGPGPRYFGGPSAGPPVGGAAEYRRRFLEENDPQTVAQVIVSGIPDKDVSSRVYASFRKENRQMMSTGRTEMTILLAPVTDLDALAAEITFGTPEIDRGSRIIRVRFDAAKFPAAEPPK